MVRDMPGSRDPSPPTEWRRWDDLPHRLFFAHSSPTWDGGGVAFVDFGEDLRGSPGSQTGSRTETEAAVEDWTQRAERRGTSALGVTYRLYRVTLEQFNDVLAQENGMPPGDAACREMTAEEARRLARADPRHSAETATTSSAVKFSSPAMAATAATEASSSFRTHGRQHIARESGMYSS
jgi:histone deacetylase 6